MYESQHDPAYNIKTKIAQHKKIYINIEHIVYKTKSLFTEQHIYTILITLIWRVYEI